jgi:hypothetical protein
MLDPMSDPCCYKKNKTTSFINESGLEFKDISSEKYRKYVFPNGKELKIIKPLYLNISESGGHRLFDASGISWYIKPNEGWYIQWKAENGKPNFVK